MCVRVCVCIALFCSVTQKPPPSLALNTWNKQMTFSVPTKMEMQFGKQWTEFGFFLIAHGSLVCSVQCIGKYEMCQSERKRKTISE